MGGVCVLALSRSSTSRSMVLEISPRLYSSLFLRRRHFHLGTCGKTLARCTAGKGTTGTWTDINRT